MRADALNGGLSVPAELAIGVVVAGVNAGFSFVSGVSTPKTAAVYMFASTLGSVLLRHGVHVGVEYLGSAIGLSEGVKSGGKLLSELVVGHGVGQVIAKDLCNREVTHFDAVKLRAGSGISMGVIAGMALWIFQPPPQPSQIDPEALEELLGLLEEAKKELEAANGELIASGQRFELIEVMPLENVTQVI